MKMPDSLPLVFLRRRRRLPFPVWPRFSPRKTAVSDFRNRNFLKYFFPEAAHLGGKYEKGDISIGNVTSLQLLFRSIWSIINMTIEKTVRSGTTS